MFNKLITDSAEAERIRKLPLDNAAGTMLLKFMFSANKFNIVKGKPDSLVKRLGVSRWDFVHGVKSLKKADLIRKYTRWEYMINPHVMLNGDERQRYIVEHMWENQTLGNRDAGK